MNILIAGASGFIGSELVKFLKKTHKLTVLGRSKKKLTAKFAKDAVRFLTWDELPSVDACEFDVVINLCGLNIGDSRWTNSVKAELISSRVSTTKIITDWLIRYGAKPRFLCANAVGIYGASSQDDSVDFDENSFVDFNHPKDFLSKIGAEWQHALQPAINAGMAVVSMRFGVVLKKGQGVLKKLAPSFYLGVGAILGNGMQVISWIHIDDLVAGIVFLVERQELTGVFNLTAPFPVKQVEFAKAIAKSVHRPLFFRLPDFLVRLMFGEMGEYLLLKGQRVRPKRIMELGFNFKYPKLQMALAHEFEKPNKII